jgi:hypothetical protein
MLRTYKPLANHAVFVYQEHVEHLICNVWCAAQAGTDCRDLLTPAFEVFYNRTGKSIWIKEGVDEIYEICKALTAAERTAIKEAFYINNDIDSFCEASKTPVELNTLHPVVENKMKPLLIKFYSDLIGKSIKLKYYNDLKTHNGDFKFCLCCGLLPVESAESHYREDNDHYLPKAEYPFASVNFGNLPPLCSKCNKKCKSTKNPFENGRKSFYAFKPLDNEFEITVTINAVNATSYLALKENEVELTFNNDPDKVDTWHWLFQINSRYNEEVRQFSKTELRMLANRFKRNDERKKGETYEQILNDAIEDYEIDKYDDRKFLKKSFLKEMLNKPDWMGVYDKLIVQV